MTNDLNFLELERKKHLKYYYLNIVFNTLALLMLGVPAIIFIVKISTSTIVIQDWPFITLMIGLLLMTGFFILAYFENKKVREFKNLVFDSLAGEIIANIYTEEVIFETTKGLEKNEVLDSKFFTQPGRFKSSNLLSGQYHGVDFKMSDFLLWENGSNSNGDCAQGRMLIINVPTKRSLDILVIEKGEGPFRKSSHQKKLVLADKQFSKKFNIYSEESTEVLNFLNPEMRQAFLDIKNNFKGLIYFHLIEKFCYIAIIDNKKSLNFHMTHPLNRETINNLIPAFSVPKVFIKAFIANEQYN
ncbi:MAG: DUF3137 domain-containing protein [Acholeplasmatales bacterium]|jgi:hypothetical protein|nr:DUF3137 domain-containing protein [Acholeplasmatales bacterium]